jgi:HK97 family phage portal protein
LTLLRPAEQRGAVSTGSPTYNPFENPAIPLAAVGLDTVFGDQISDAGATVTADTAIGVATFYRCLFLLSSVVGSCPIEVFRSKTHELVPNDLFDEANDDLTYTPFELKQLIMVYRLVWGNSYVFKKRNGVDKIVDLKPLYPELVDVRPGPDGHKIFLVKRLRTDGSIDESSPPQVFTDWEIMHIPNLGYNGLTGLSIVSLMKQTLGTAIAADQLAAKFYSQGSQLGGIIKVKAPLRNQAQAEGIKSRWMQNNAGVGQAGKVAVLDAETDFQSVTIPPDQLQFLESRKWQTTEIARWCGVPPHLVGDVEKSTSWGSGIETQNIGLTTYTLSGHFTPIEQRFTREVVQTRGQVAKFNLDSMMRGTTTERYAALFQATGGPWMSRNEARISENKMPLDGAEYDELLPPQGIGTPPGQEPAPQQSDSSEDSK